MKTLRISCKISAPGIAVAVSGKAGRTITVKPEEGEAADSLVTDIGDYIVDENSDYIVFEDDKERKPKVSGELKENDRIKVIYGESEDQSG